MIPFVMINLDKPRKLRFGMGAMMEYEQLTGKKLADLAEEISYEANGNLLWVMLRQDDPDLTLKQVQELVDDHAETLTDIITKVGDMVRGAFGSGKKGKNA